MPARCGRVGIFRLCDRSVVQTATHAWGFKGARLASAGIGFAEFFGSDGLAPCALGTSGKGFDVGLSLYDTGTSLR